MVLSCLYWLFRHLVGLVVLRGRLEAANLTRPTEAPSTTSPTRRDRTRAAHPGALTSRAISPRARPAQRLPTG